MKQFDEGYWRGHLSHQDWYIRLERDLRNDIFPMMRDDASLADYRDQVYRLVADMLKLGQLPLAESGPDLDTQRAPVTTIIIHHTEEDSDISLDKLSAIGLVRQYALKYLDDNVLGNKVRGQAIWSGHFREDRMVFFAYHWLVRPDGKVERLLNDSDYGNHALQANPYSIGIAFSGDYTESSPSLKQIQAAAKVIREHYPDIPVDQILGHCEVLDRTCPSKSFLTEWKQILLKEILDETNR